MGITSEFRCGKARSPSYVAGGNPSVGGNRAPLHTNEICRSARSTSISTLSDFPDHQHAAALQIQADTAREPNLPTSIAFGRSSKSGIDPAVIPHNNADEKSVGVQFFPLGIVERPKLPNIARPAIVSSFLEQGGMGNVRSNTMGRVKMEPEVKRSPNTLPSEPKAPHGLEYHDPRAIYSSSGTRTDVLETSGYILSDHQSPSSTLSTMSTPSTSFGNDPIISDEENAWDGDERSYDFQTAECKLDFERMNKLGNSKNSVLCSSKSSLAGQLMEESCAIFDPEWLANIHKCAGSSSSLPSKSMIETPSSSADLSQSTPRKRATDESEDSPEDRNRNPKRPKKAKGYPKDPSSLLEFACPYRKRDPKKYNATVPKWQKCALNSFETVSRVKEHLYRDHRIFQCPRCSNSFENELELHSHTRAVQACNLEPAILIDGITDELKEQLKLKKFAHNNKSKEVQWNAVYCLLFPGEEIPSPYFEFLREENAHSLGKTALSDFEGFLRCELPHKVESAVRNYIDYEAEPSLERLRRELPQLIQKCQDRVFAEYRSLKAMSHPHLHSNKEKQDTALINAAQSGTKYQQHSSALSFYQYDFDTGLKDINQAFSHENTNQNMRVDLEHFNNLPEQEDKTSDEMPADPVEIMAHQETQARFEDTEHTEGREAIDKFIEQYCSMNANNMAEDVLDALPKGDSFDVSQFKDSNTFDWGA